MIRSWIKNIGPGPLVAAAFIGPGTVTLCTIAGVSFGFALLWALLFSLFATIVLQEMSARIGVISGKGLAEIMRSEIKNPIFRGFVTVLMLSAIVVGNAAYEAGNISGGVLGLEVLVGSPTLLIGAFSIKVLSVIIGVLAFLLLYIGNYKILERVLISLVIIMSFAFLIAAFMTRPNVMEILKGLFQFKTPTGSLFTVIGLIGTTVVPYNLFLHAALAKEKWHSESDLKFARKDTIIAVSLGCIVSMCIIIAAASITSDNIKTAADLAKGLEPLFGAYAKYFLSIGLFAAGITSAITAPLAAAFVTSGCLGWETNLRSFKFRSVWFFILLLGVIFSSLNIKSIEIIKFAQVANGALLPITAIFLIWLMNKSNVLGKYVNTKLQNGLGIIIVGITFFLGIKSILKVFNSI